MTHAALGLTPLGRTPYRFDEERPRLEGAGPAECSSSRVLSVLPAVIYDVNGYYRDLGVSPFAGRRQLREAYQALDGQSSTRLTYVLKQLINPSIRFAYDCTSLGEVFFDQYVADAIKRAMLDKKSQRLQDLHDAGVTNLSEETLEGLERDIYSEMGIETESGDTPGETVDSPHETQQTPKSPANAFPYAYYLFRSQSFVDGPERERLGEWQRLLVASLAEQGIVMKFSVGFHGEPRRWVSMVVGARQVFLLGRREHPTAELASLAVARVVKDRTTSENHPLANTDW